MKKMPSFGPKKTLKKSRTSQFSINDIDISKINEEDMLTYLKMKRLKNLFNVSKEQGKSK